MKEIVKPLFNLPNWLKDKPRIRRKRGLCTRCKMEEAEESSSDHEVNNFMNSDSDAN